MNHFNKTIHIIGTGMDGDRTLTLEARRAIEQAELLIGAQRMLKPFEALKKPMLCCYDGRKTAALIADSEYSEIAVLVSGDGGFYSAAGTLLPLLREYRTELISGISTPVYLCAKAGLPWSDMRFVSLHGTDAPFVRMICANRYTFLLLGGRVTPADVCRRLCEYGRGEVRVVIGENLSSPKEAVHSGTAAEYREYNADRLCAMIVENEQYERHLPSCIPDGAFIRGGVPMTKSEVRGVCVARLTVGESDVCWDIGCGTGSVAVEMALRCPKGRVLAVDKNAEAISLTEQNLRKFGCDNIEPVPGLAEELAERLPAPDCVFVGGSCGALGDVLSVALKKNPDARILVTAVSLETLSQSADLFAARGLESEITEIAVTRTRKAGSHTLLSAENPIFIIHRKC